MTKPFATLIANELALMNEGLSGWGEVLVDPDIIALNDDNPALVRAFSESQLDVENSDHWKLILTVVLSVVYSPRKPGPGRSPVWTPEWTLRLILWACKVRLAEPNLSIPDICEKLADEHPDFARYSGGSYLKGKVFGWLKHAKSKVAPIEDPHGEKLNLHSEANGAAIWILSPKGAAEIKRLRRCG